MGVSGFDQESKVGTFAIVSDLHANIEAVREVLKDIDSQDIEDIVCLGDVVGYGPEPERCIDIVMKRCRFCLSGNHDYAVLTIAERFNPLAEEAVNFTRNELRPGFFSLRRRRRRWQFLRDQLLSKRETDILYVHGSPRDERNEYILESDITFGNYDKIEECFSRVPRLCFIGHSHVPGLVTEEMEYYAPEDVDYEYELAPEMKYIINVGSVGQPRDGDNRSCYAVMEINANSKDKVHWRRVEYDFKKTMEKMARVGPISRDAAKRLEEGR